jgi:phosphoribosylaminoimidazole-succinocarboxamide synthase
MNHLLIYNGKVRDIYSLGENYLLLKASDRVSSFDRHIGIIPGKGKLLNQMSEFWFNKTKEIIPNHFISSEKDVLLVKRCKPIMLEIVVRGYITGSTSTSLWTHYNNGSRLYSGNILPEGLVKNQKLKSPIITPTTKGKVDVPISKATIVQEGYMTRNECDFIYKKALELFDYGQKLASKAGFILVDTKYEFGRDDEGNIILMDELHTCDSSRYWIKETYEERFLKNLEPEKLDKDCVRDWVKSVCDPYNDVIPEIPKEIINKAYNSYKYFYDTISNIQNISDDKFNNCLVIIISGSIKDEKHVNNIKTYINELNIPYISEIASAHKNTYKVMNLINKYNFEEKKIIWITVAGRSNALSGVIAANSIFPVIACPPFSDKIDMTVNLHSTLQCPSKVPVMVVLEPSNVALCVKRMFSL